MSISTFSLILIQNIAKHIHDPIDSICFALTCKRFFDLREKYLVINTTKREIFDKSHYDSNFFLLKSFKTIIKNSFELKQFTLTCHHQEGLLIDKSKLPNDLNHLIIGLNYDYNFLPNQLPETLEVLEFDPFSINRSNFVKGSLPQSLRVLILSNAFDYPLLPGDLPPQLEELYFGKGFNQQFLENSLPSSLKTLLLGDRYDQPIEESILPVGLETLILGHDFNRPLTFLPPSITKLTLVGQFNHPIPDAHSLPNLRNLTLDSSKFTYTSSIPSTLSKLKIIGSSITRLTTHLYADLTTTSSLDLPLLRKLVYSRLFNSSIAPNVIPISVKTVKLGYFYEKVLEMNSFPDGLTKLDLGQTFNQVIQAGVLPSTLTHLQLGGRFNQIIEPGVLPPSLESLEFGTTKSSFHSNPLIDFVPSSVKYISLPLGYIYELPPTIETIKLLENTIESIYNHNFIMFRNQPVTTTIVMDVKIYDTIRIRRLDNKYSLVISDFIDGGYIETEMLVDGSFWQEIRLLDMEETFEEIMEYEEENFIKDDFDSDYDDNTEDELDAYYYCNELIIRAQNEQHTMLQLQLQNQQPQLVPSSQFDGPVLPAPQFTFPPTQELPNNSTNHYLVSTSSGGFMFGVPVQIPPSPFTATPMPLPSSNTINNSSQTPTMNDSTNNFQLPASFSISTPVSLPNNNNNNSVQPQFFSGPLYGGPSSGVQLPSSLFTTPTPSNTTSNSVQSTNTPSSNTIRNEDELSKGL